MNTAQQIRKELKDNGYTNKQISVRTNGGHVNVTIKDFSIQKSEIQEMTRKYEYYTRDEMTGEILCGGNTFVFVEYAFHKLSDHIEAARKQVVEIFATCNVTDFRSFGCFVNDIKDEFKAILAVEYFNKYYNVLRVEYGF